MSYPLRQSTAQILPMGVIVDAADGYTPETGLTITGSQIQLRKAGAITLEEKESGGASNMGFGCYYTTLSTGDTGTLGPMTVFVIATGARPVRVDCVVHPPLVYDSLYGTGKLEVNMVDVEGDGAMDQLQIASAQALNAMRLGELLTADMTDPPAAGSLFGDLLADDSGTWVMQLESAILTAIGDLNDPAVADIASAVWSAVSRTLTDKTGMKLASDGLDSITSTEVGAAAADNFRKKVLKVYEHLRHKSVLDTNAGTLKHFQSDDATVAATRTVSASGGVHTLGKAT